MKYTASDQIEYECDGRYQFKIAEASDGRFEYRYLGLTSEVEPQHRSDHYAFVMAVVASEPPFLRKEDCAWILAYLHELRSSADLLNPNRRGSPVLNMLLCYARENDIISLTRLMYSLDIARDILGRGLVVEHDYFTSDDDRNWIAQRYDIDFLPEDEDCSDVAALAFGYDKDFKRMMTQQFFSGAEVEVAIPPEEELVASNPAFVENCDFQVFTARISRFYKSGLHWSNRGFLELYPRFKGTPRLRLETEPLFPVQLPPITTYGIPCSVIAYIPLHWIASVSFNGDCRVASLSDKPGVMRLQGYY
ncbi:hypothetical protein NPS53_09415 [Pseudomonas putida]|uniref:hypothetical protein n=1 Tax=Pseudomonas putida TaxID=303 RepID=UPI0023635019|nr:hypothetical protein [Pseudomonas putida]MDD2139795.1 hypothetical protein [Pseudomonas putida]HDS1721719.1 hypothetical protein [Pseudomonas putida]